MAKSIEELPDEMKLRIFSYFTPIQLSRTISLVCTDWWILSKDPYLWKHVIIRFANPNKTDFNEQRVDKISTVLQRCTMLEQLSIERRGLSSKFEHPENLLGAILSIQSLKALFFNRINWKEDELKQIIKSYPFIEKVSLEKCALNMITKDFVNRCATLVNLREFTLVNSVSGMNFDDNCIEILSRECRKLETINIELGNITKAGIVELAVNRNQTLTKVRLICIRNETLNNGFAHLGFCHKLKSLELEGFNVLSKASLQSLSELPVLETLHLVVSWKTYVKCTPDERTDMENGFEIFFSNQFRSKLKNVHFSRLSLGESALINMSQTCSNLQKLSLYVCFGITEYGVREVFEKCSELKIVMIQECDPLVDDYRATIVKNVLSVNKIYART